MVCNASVQVRMSAPKPVIVAHRQNHLNPALAALHTEPHICFGACFNTTWSGIVFIRLLKSAKTVMGSRFVPLRIGSP